MTLPTAAIALATLLVPSAAMACSCIPAPPEEIRGRADVIIQGRVLEVTREGGRNGEVTARISVTRRMKGMVPRAIAVQTRGNSAMCGYSFAVGQAREFLLTRSDGRYATSLCLMRGARR